MSTGKLAGRDDRLGVARHVTNRFVALPSLNFLFDSCRLIRKLVSSFKIQIFPPL